MTNTQIASTETKFTRTKANFFDPVLSANAYVGRVKETERIVELQPNLFASDADPPATLNGLLLFIRLFAHLRKTNLFSLQVKFAVTSYHYINMMIFSMIQYKIFHLLLKLTINSLLLNLNQTSINLIVR